MLILKHVFSSALMLTSPVAPRECWSTLLKGRCEETSTRSSHKGHQAHLSFSKHSSSLQPEPVTPCPLVEVLLSFLEEVVSTGGRQLLELRIPERKNHRMNHIHKKSRVVPSEHKLYVHPSPSTNKPHHPRSDCDCHNYS